MIMPRNKTVKLKTPGLTLKRKILEVWAQSPHEEASHFLAYPCTDSYEEPELKLSATFFLFYVPIFQSYPCQSHSVIARSAATRQSLPVTPANNCHPCEGRGLSSALLPLCHSRESGTRSEAQSRDSESILRPEKAK